MREKPLHGGSIGSWPLVRGARVVALAGLWLGIVTAAPAAAAACPNAQFRSGPSEHLPDCRAYEQVSPVEKAGADAVTTQRLFPAQASACESDETCAVVFMNGGSAFAGAQGNELPNAYLASRGADGWQTTPLTPPTLQAPANGPAKVAYAFSADLSQAVVRVPFQRLTEDAPAGVYNLFLRQPNGSYSLVTASAPPVPPQSGCGGCFEAEDVPAFAGASGDFSHILFEANDGLLEGAPGGGVENLYETVAEHVRLVGILPDGTVPPQGATAAGGIGVTGQRTGELNHAISQDGSDVLFAAAADGGAPDPAQAGRTELYDRVDGSSTIEISAPADGAKPGECHTKQGICDAGSARFRAASADGSIVYFTSKAALTKESNTGAEERSEAEKEAEEETGEPGENPGNDLYQYNLDSGKLTDLTVDEKDPIGANVLGVVGAAEDGSYVYFVADGRLADAPLSGQPNLYVWHGTAEGGGTVKFIATLQAPDEEEEENIEAASVGPAFPYESDIADWTSRPIESQAYVTPDGEHLAFMSVKPLTDYNNEDQTTGEADHEVFEYSAETGQLVCASCDANGARPLGSAFIGAKLTERVSTPFYQPRSLNDDGTRLFFSSPDPLVSGLSGGVTKIFEYENGSAQLISGIGDSSDDVFLDASASGNDVFFATREQLAPSDSDELIDVYDARVDGGFAAPAVPALPCQGSTCQEPFSPPPSFSTPISASFTGAGNFLLSSRPLRLTSRQRLLRALAECERLKRMNRRSACIAAARRRYAPEARRARHDTVRRRRRTRR